MGLFKNSLLTVGIKARLEPCQLLLGLCHVLTGLGGWIWTIRLSLVAATREKQNSDKNVNVQLLGHGSL